MKQREMPVLGDIKREIEEVPRHIIEACKTKQEAIRMCVNWSGIQHGALAEMLNIDAGNFSRMMTGSAQLPHNKEKLLQEICGNKIIIEWQNWDWNQKSVPIDNSEKIAALEAQLKQLQEAS